MGHLRKKLNRMRWLLLLGAGLYIVIVGGQRFLAGNLHGMAEEGKAAVQRVCQREFAHCLYPGLFLEYEEEEMEDAEIGIVCYGGTTRAVQEAIRMAREDGYKVGMFRPVTIWPFPEYELVNRAKQLKRLIVVEHNYGQILLTVQGIIKGDTKVEFIGKVDGTTIRPDEIYDKITDEEE